jgi:hypothetical protein
MEDLDDGLEEEISKEVSNPRGLDLNNQVPSGDIARRPPLGEGFDFQIGLFRVQQLG